MGILEASRSCRPHARDRSKRSIRSSPTAYLSTAPALLSSRHWGAAGRKVSWFQIRESKASTTAEIVCTAALPGISTVL